MSVLVIIPLFLSAFESYLLKKPNSIMKVCCSCGDLYKAPLDVLDYNVL